MAARLFGHFPPPDVGDPQVLLAGAVKIFASYPESAVEAVCDPLRGIPGRSKWAPTLSEIRQALEVEVVPMRRAMEREAMERRQIAERKQLAIAHDKPRPTYEELVQQCADVGLQIGKQSKTGGKLAPRDFMERYGVSREQFDAIPNAK